MKTIKHVLLSVVLAAIVVFFHYNICFSLPFDPFFQKEGLGDFDQKQDSWGHYRGEPYVDDNKNGKYDVGEDFHDLDGSGSWDSTNLHHAFSPLWSNWSWDYCAPTSAANSIWYFANNGWSKLWPTGSVASDIITKLAEYMNTWNDFGTTALNLANGWKSYFEEYYPGWFNTKTVIDPKLDWLKGEIFKCEDVLLWLTWYYEDDGKWIKDGAHIVTLAGYGKDENGNENPNYIKIHDPYQDVGGTPDDYYLTQFWGSDLYINYGNYRGVIDIAFSSSPIPEPATMLLLGFGLFGLAGLRRKLRKN